MATITFTPDHVFDLTQVSPQTDTLLPQADTLLHCHNTSSQPGSSNCWSQIFLSLLARELLSFIFHKARTSYLTISEIISAKAQSLPYTSFPTSAAANADHGPPVGDQLTVRLDIQDGNTTNTSDSCNFVKERNMESVHKSGEIDIENAENDGRLAAYGYTSYRERLNPATALFHLVYKPVKDWTMLLLFCSAALFLLSGASCGLLHVYPRIPRKMTRQSPAKSLSFLSAMRQLLMPNTISVLPRWP